MGAKGSKDHEIIIQKQVTEKPVHGHNHIGIILSNFPQKLHEHEKK